ncbi:MAG: hypothetical protein M3O20_02090 [Acidobacteriota bacterium]|nr:hypothetical protein [Acidobacteriota bacterium]
MTKLVITGLFTLAHIFAQVTLPQASATATPAVKTASEPAPTASTAPAAAPTCSGSSFYAAGGTYNTAASPAFSGFYAIATPVTKCGATFQAYSITMNVLQPSGGGKNLTFTDTTTTGAAIPLKQIGPINIYAFGNLGVAATATATKLGSGWGGFATVPLPFWNLKFIPIGQSVNGGKWNFGAALGRSW